MTVVQPFKKESKHLYTNTLFMLLLALIYIFAMQIRKPYYTEVFMLLATVAGAFPLLYLSALIVHWLYSHRRFGGQLVRTLQAWRHGYQSLQ